MVKSKKQEIFRKLNTSGAGDSDVGKWVFSSFVSFSPLILTKSLHLLISMPKCFHSFELYFVRMLFCGF